MTRRTWAITILAAWAASLGWLVKREVFRPTGTRLAEAALSVPPGAVYYRLNVAGQQVGFASSTIDTQATSIGVTDILVLRIPALGVLHRTAAMSRATLSRTLRLERVDARFDGDLGRFAARSLVAESTLVVADSAGYDSTALAWVPAHFDTVRAFRIEQHDGGMTTRAWIDAQGHIVRAENAVGFVMERTAFELAYTNFRHRDTTRLIRASIAPGPGDVVATTVLAARAPLPHDTLSLLRVRLRGVAAEALDLGGGRQQLSGDTLVIRRETRAALAARYPLPARDSSFARWLAPGPLIQSDDPRLQAQARLIIGREQDPARAARRLATWVHAHVARRSAATVPSARQVLEARVGDCNEHAVLFVALARAAGLPARTVAGLVPVDGRFYYHAWAEVYLGDWVAVDPMLDEFPAGAAHVRFSIDGLARQAELVRRIGRIKLEVL